ncbi:uncharacterized protein LOC122654129 [Telopea speciosissima]|uniref:uncharacterized protein LOC122654129 n=1 Tax=Telopea speciosissima TaxID=54955 RepID=UPI001CC60A36|nr:uncharacterized protein LOC122654129 [Telopea speciosissima]
MGYPLDPFEERSLLWLLPADIHAEIWQPADIELFSDMQKTSSCKQFLAMENNDEAVNIDYHYDDPELAEDIYKHWKEYEGNNLPNMERVQKNINTDMREVLIDWIVVACEICNLSPETFYLTINCIDRYISNTVIQMSQLQLVGIGCLMIAIKYEEECHGSAMELVLYLTKYTYSKEQIIKMEETILSCLQFELAAPTAQYEEEELHPTPTLSQSLIDELPLPPQEQKQEENEDDGDDFEFPVFGRDPDLSPKTADEIFYNGQIRPIFPIFNRKPLIADGHDYDSKPPKNRSSHRHPLRKLMIEERNNDDPPSSSSSEADELESVPDGTYCVWTPKPVEPSPETCKKSNSTGFSKRTWKIRDLLYRSNSEGMDTYVFLSPSKTLMMKRNDKTEKAADRVENDKSSHHHHHHQQQQQPKERSNSVPGQVKVAAAKGKVKSKGGSSEAVSAHEIHYVRYRALKVEDRRRSYLPYRQELVGLFANGNGASSRSLHPF